MINSFPTRNSPFRKSVTMDDMSSKTKQRSQSLKIVTASSVEEQPEPSRVRRRLSSLLFRTSSPVITNLKVTFNNKRASFTTSPMTEEEEEDDSHSTATTLSSGSSDHMPASPSDSRTIFQDNTTLATVWQPSVTILSYPLPGVVTDTEHQSKDKETTTTSPPLPPSHQTYSSLAFQVNQILGSTLDQVDEEIDQDWEKSRNLLRQSLVLKSSSRNQLFWF